MGAKQTGTTTSTTTSAPWAPQQPYLENIFSQAQNLYNTGGPQYYPGATYAPETGLQALGITGAANAGMNDQAAGTAGNSLTNFLQGDYLYSNPAMQGFANLSNNNWGLTNAGFGELANVANGANPGTANSGANTLAALAGSDLYGMAPGNSAFSSYASGTRTAAGNPYTTALSQDVLSQVVPSIQKQFVDSGTLSSPEAARATAAGATAALAPSLFQNYQNEEANQLAAGGALNNAFLNAAGLRGQLGNEFANLALGGIGQQAAAASTLGQQTIQGENAQNQALSGLSGAYTSGTQQMLEAMGLAPSVQQMPFTDFAQIYSSGQLQQQLQQQAINDAVARWNYQQTLPYQALNEYIGQVTGNYGGTSVANQPIVSNPMQNVLGGIQTGAQTVGGVMSMLPFFMK